MPRDCYLQPFVKLVILIRLNLQDIQFHLNLVDYYYVQ